MVDLLSSLPDPPPEFEAAHSPRPRVVVCGPYASRGAREGPALVDLVGHVPGAPPEIGRGCYSRTAKVL